MKMAAVFPWLLLPPAFFVARTGVMAHIGQCLHEETHANYGANP